MESLHQEPVNPGQARVLWFTGLSGSGKSTLAVALREKLQQLGLCTVFLDGNLVREGLNRDLGFSMADRMENIRRVAEICKILVANGIIVLCAFISPTAAIRNTARQIIGTDCFTEIYVRTPLGICAERDPRGLYARSLTGGIRDFTGISSPYEVPENPDLVIDTRETPVEENVQTILAAVLPLLVCAEADHQG